MPTDKDGVECVPRGRLEDGLVVAVRGTEVEERWAEDMGDAHGKMCATRGMRTTRGTHTGRGRRARGKGLGELGGRTSPVR